MIDIFTIRDCVKEEHCDTARSSKNRIEGVLLRDITASTEMRNEGIFIRCKYRRSVLPSHRNSHKTSLSRFRCDGFLHFNNIGGCMFQKNSIIRWTWAFSCVVLASYSPKPERMKKLIKYWFVYMYDKTILRIQWNITSYADWLAENKKYTSERNVIKSNTLKYQSMTDT